MVVAVHLAHGSATTGRQRSAHGQPHQQLDALCASHFHQFMNAELRGPLGVGQQAVYELQRQTPEGAREAYTNLTKAVDFDPQFTAAHYKLFEVYFDNWGENLPPVGSTTV